ncbi:MAG TPA: hypothetical protein VHX38_16845 [Pseudonocardiaceae bacterium]|jgi:hypothetical protein|nr:hypothetical protein [Pseudonocardiaceae bacterium]
MTEQEPQDAEKRGAADGSNIYRAHAAQFASLADEFAEMSDKLARTFEEVKPIFTGSAAEEAKLAHESLASMPTGLQAMADRAQLIGQANAAMSFTYEELAASGDPDNPEALARYQEAVQWYGDLLGTERPEGDISPMS